MADSVGNRLGKRGTFSYTTDTGETINFTQDDSVGKAVGNIVATTRRRPQSVNNRYLQGRYILVQGIDDPTIRKKIVIGNVLNPLMTTDEGGIVTINSVQFAVTGRAGEQMTFLQLTQPAPTP